MGSVPSVLINARVYDAGNVLLGQSDVEIGDLEYMSESITGLGLAGELDMPVLGHFKSLSLTLKWNTVCPEAMKLTQPKTHQLAIYASIQNWEESEGVFKAVPCRVNMRGVPKKGGIGEFELIYLKMSINGKEVVEIDKVNFKCMINGVDYLADVRSHLGQ